MGQTGTNKVRRRPKANAAAAIKFSPGRVLGPWLVKFQKAHSLDNVQDAIRRILRERKEREDAGAQAK